MTTHKTFSFNRKYVLMSCTFIIFAAFWFVTLSPVGNAKGKAQKADKIVEKGDDFIPPVTITLIKSKIGVIETDKKIEAGDEWLEGLAVRVRNDSSKPVKHVSVELLFPRPPAKVQDYDFVSTLEYGPNPFRLPPLDSSESPDLILPGQTIEILLSDAQYEEITSSLDELRYPKSIKKLRMGIRTVGFSDGTVWTVGLMLGPDPNNPGRLIRLNKDQARSRVKGAMRFTKIALVKPEPASAQYSWCGSPAPEATERGGCTSDHNCKYNEWLIEAASELETLSSSTVAVIHLDYKESKRVDEHGNQFKYRAKVDDAKGAKVGRWAWDAFLTTAP